MKTECPRCFRPLNANTGYTTDHNPKPGDYSFCLYCATPLMFDDVLEVRELTEGELKEAEKDMSWRKARLWVIRKVNADRAKPRGAGRYDPCPCGSGKKFKWCCEPGARERMS